MSKGAGWYVMKHTQKNTGIIVNLAETPDETYWRHTGFGLGWGPYATRAKAQQTADYQHVRILPGRGTIALSNPISKTDQIMEALEKSHSNSIHYYLHSGDRKLLEKIRKMARYWARYKNIDPQIAVRNIAVGLNIPTSGLDSVSNPIKDVYRIVKGPMGYDVYSPDEFQRIFPGRKPPVVASYPTKKAAWEVAQGMNEDQERIDEGEENPIKGDDMEFISIIARVITDQYAEYSFDRNEMVKYLTDRAASTIKNYKPWKNFKLNNAGRDKLHAFMKHWLVGKLAKDGILIGERKDREIESSWYGSARPNPLDTRGFEGTNAQWRMAQRMDAFHHAYRIWDDGPGKQKVITASGRTVWTPKTDEEKDIFQDPFKLVNYLVNSGRIRLEGESPRKSNPVTYLERGDKVVTLTGDIGIVNTVANNYAYVEYEHNGKLERSNIPFHALQKLNEQGEVIVNVKAP